MSTVSPRPARLQYQRRDAVADEVGRRLGLRPGSAHQVLVGALPHRVAEIIRAHATVGAYDRLHRWLQPINDALDGIQAPALCAALIASAQHADCVEDEAQVAYLSDPCERTARAYARALGNEVTLSRNLQLALGREWGFQP